MAVAWGAARPLQTLSCVLSQKEATFEGASGRRGSGCGAGSLHQ
jgi:hypothetical protein